MGEKVQREEEEVGTGGEEQRRTFIREAVRRKSS